MTMKQYPLLEQYPLLQQTCYNDILCGAGTRGPRPISSTILYAILGFMVRHIFMKTLILINKSHVLYTNCNGTTQSSGTNTPS